jgi:lysophospholipase L1-like esterase
MIPLLVYIITIVFLLLVNVLVYYYAKNKGEKDFLEVLFAAGLMGKVDAFRHYNEFSKEGGIVFVGDSITQDFNVYEYFPGKQVYNRGIGGDTSQGVLTRLNESIFDLKPSKVILQIGTNDLELLDDGVEAIHQRIKRIIKEIKTFDKSIDIVLLSVYPVNPLIDRKTVGKRKNQDIQELNHLLSQVDEVIYLDIYSQLEKDNVLNPDYTLEGLHLNQKGYQVIKKEIEEFMD